MADSTFYVNNVHLNLSLSANSGTYFHNMVLVPINRPS